MDSMAAIVMVIGTILTFLYIIFTWVFRLGLIALVISFFIKPKESDTNRNRNESNNLLIIRSHSLDVAKQLGYEVNDHLPLLDNSLVLRPIGEIVNRSLVLYSLIACAFGFSKSKALLWLKKEDLFNQLTQDEVLFLEGKSKDKKYFQEGVEALNAFAWMLDFVKELKFDEYCAENLVEQFPNIKNESSTLHFKNSARLKSEEIILQQLDVSFCLHWSLVQQKLNGSKADGQVSSYVVIQRRKALEWAFSGCCWSEVDLST